MSIRYLNQVQLIGYAGGDPIIKSVGGTKQMANFSLSTSDSWKDKTTGELHERTEWHRVVIFHDGIIQVVKNYIKKGSKVFVQGSLQTRKYKSQDGGDKTITEIVLQSKTAMLILLDRNSNSEKDESDDVSGSTYNDDLPF